ncbi:MAG: fatty acid desaturase [Flavobacteriia bacterium]|jgi:fatty acid desaturase
MNKSVLEFGREINLEKKFRKNSFFIPFVTILSASLLLSGIYFCIILFQKHQYWSVIPAAFLIHSFFVVVVHDAAHNSITKTKFDRVILNLGAGIMLLPFYGEAFRKFHLIHHAQTNKENDPLWSPLKQQLFQKNRILYLLFEIVPLFSTIYSVLNFSKSQKTKPKAHNIKSVKINYWFMLTACLVSVGIYFLVKPPLWFLLGTLFILNIISTLRHWSEHLGEEKNKESNTYWFPLGMGIGNHETHHHHAYMSWFTLMIGLFYRKKDTHPLKVIQGVMISRKYEHYRSE